MPQVAIGPLRMSCREGFRAPDRALCGPSLGPLDDRKRTMDYSLLAYTLINDMKSGESQCVLKE
jgi:hypothetical protein